MIQSAANDSLSQMPESVQLCAPGKKLGMKWYHQELERTKRVQSSAYRFTGWGISCPGDYLNLPGLWR